MTAALVNLLSPESRQHMNDIILINIKLSQRTPSSGVLISVLVTQMDDRGMERTLLNRDFNTVSIQPIFQTNRTFQESYRNWGNSCRYGEIPFRLSRELTIIDGTTNGGDYDCDKEKERRNNCRTALSRVIGELSQWLNQSIQSEFVDLILNKLIADPHNLPIRLVFEIFETEESTQLRDLPWDACVQSSLISRLYGINKPVHIVIGAGTIVDKRIWRNLSNILIIQGGDRNIDTDLDISFIKSHLPPHISPIIERLPSVDNLNRLLWDNNWDAIFYLGHTDTDDTGSDGLIHINENQTVSINDLSNAFVRSVERGLQLLVFNSCSGEGLTRKLNATLRTQHKRLPYIIVMRRPIGDSIAHAFIDRFTKHLFVDKYSVEKAITETKKFLQGLQYEFPGADSLPVLWCDNKAFPLTVADPKLPRVEDEETGSTKTPSTEKQTGFTQDLNKPSILTQSVNILWNPRFMKLPPIAYILAAPLILYFGSQFWPKSIPEIEESIGAKSLFSQKTSQAKKEGIEAFRRGEYDRAIDRFKASLQSDMNDAETTIYLNNSIILNNSKNSSQLPIIPVISSSSNGYSTAVEVLSGAAVAQMGINQQGGIKGQKVLLKIVLDQNDENIARRVAKKLVAEDIKAVIGHVDSNTSVVAAPIYEKAGLMMISPTSSTMDLKSVGKYVARTAPNSVMMAKSLANYISIINKKKLGFCYDSQLVAGKTFRDAFMNQIGQQGGIIVSVNCDASEPGFSPKSIIAKMQQEGADGLVLYYHINRKYQLEAAQNLAKEAKNKFPLFGSAALVAKEITDSGQDFDGMILVTPRHADLPLARNFTNTFKQTFGVNPDWRSMTTYDALQAVAKGLNESDGSRLGLQQQLHNPNFIAQGASGDVKFSISGDRLVTPSIAQLQCQSGCKFVLISETPKS
jgi:branched-chain amino acid transport system substrate-binding protein